jgi:hypothetical protein
VGIVGRGGWGCRAVGSGAGVGTGGCGTRRRAGGTFVDQRGDVGYEHPEHVLDLVGHLKGVDVGLRLGVGVGVGLGCLTSWVTWWRRGRRGRG